MAFLDEKPEEKELEVPEKVKVGEFELDPSELEDIVGKYKEVEKVHGNLDGLVKSWGKQGDELGQLRKQNQELQGQLEEINKPKTETPNNEPTPEQVLRAATEQGFITKSNFNQAIAEYRAAEKLADEVKAIESKGNPFESKDLPPFVATDMLQYMADTGIKNPTKAYKDRYETEIDAWKEKKLSSGRPSSVVTEESSPGNKTPNPVKVTRDNFSEMIRASLHGEI